MPIAVAGYTANYAARTPYITPAEYTNAPTAVDVTQLIPGGSAAANAVELANVIGRASSYADRICHQVLAATTDTDPTRRWRVNADRRIVVPLRYKPVLEIDAISVGDTPSLLGPLGPADLADVTILGDSLVEIPYQSIGLATVGQPLPAPASTVTPGRPLVQVTYVNGWANTTLSATAAAGTAQLTVASALGVYAGTVLSVYDDATGSESVTVSSVSGTTLTLAAPTLYAHAAGVSVSALPPVVKQAVILLTSALIKTRGAVATVMAAIAASPNRTAKSEPDGVRDALEAVWMLSDFRRVR